MKKFISIIMSMIIAASVCSMAVLPVMAKTVASPSDIEQEITIKVQVNNSDTKEVVYDRDSDQITFTYTGDGNITGWEFPGMVLGVDYEIVAESDDHKSITIELLKDEEGNYIYDGVVTARALVEDEASTEPSKPSTDNKDKDSTSPKTGAVSAAGIAVAGAGVAILAALKKRD
ncbi:MAG: hypothetical protein ACI4IN_03150 [Eubacterium sp.]